MAVTSVLNILRTIKDRGSISRTDLQQVTGLSWGTITNTTRELLERNFIREEGATASKAGRKPMRLALNPARHSLIGVEITPELVRCLAMNLAGDALWYETAHVSHDEEPESVLDRTADIVRRGLSAVSSRLCLGIGVAVPGTLNVKLGAVVRAPRLHKWKDVPVRDRLQAKLNAAIRVERIANCLALAERWFGEASAAEDVLCINLGDGVGMGILHDGEIYRGAQQMAGEFGHVTLDPNGPLCACGDHGCVEAYCSLHAVIENLRAAKAYRDNMNIADIVSAANAGDPAIKTVFAQMGEKLGLGVANLIDLFNPTLVILSGQLAPAADLFLPAVREQISKHAYKQASQRILISTLGDRAVAIGACGTVLQSIFEHEIVSANGEQIAQRA
jgi:predicted NBD/HSP70 family sugar kinase